MTTEPRFLSISEAIEIHDQEILISGGLSGIRDLKALESAMGAAQASHGGGNIKDGPVYIAPPPHGGRPQMPHGCWRYKPPITSALSCRRASTPFGKGSGQVLSHQLRQGFRRAVKS